MWNSSQREKQFLFFKEFLLVLTKSSFWEGDWALDYDSRNIWDFPDISSFPKVPKYSVVRQLVKHLVNTMLITNNQDSFRLWWNKNLDNHQKVSKYYDHDYLQIFFGFRVFINNLNC